MSGEESVVKTRFWISEIETNGVHGIRSIKLENLSAKLNVVRAPNASGKSTLARAIGHILDPELKTGTVRAVLYDGETRTVFPRTSKMSIFSGRPSDYRLDLIQLLDGLDAAGTKELASELAGGLTLKVEPAVRLNNRDAVAARDRLKAARTEKENIARTEDEIPRLDEEIEDARQARSIADAIQRALDRGAVSEQINEIQEKIDSLTKDYPGIELQNLDAAARRNDFLNDLDAAKNALERADRNLRDGWGGEPAKPLAEVDRERLSRAVLDSATAQAQLKEAMASLGHAQSAAKEASGQLFSSAPDAEPDNWREIPPEAFQSLLEAGTKRQELTVKAYERMGYSAAADKWSRDHAREMPTDAEVRQVIAALSEEAKDLRVLTLLGIAIIGAIVAAVLPEGTAKWAVVGVVIIAALLAFYIQKPKSVDPKADLANRLESLLERKAEASALKTLKDQVPAEPDPDPWPGVCEPYGLKLNDPLRSMAIVHLIRAYQLARIQLQESKADVERFTESVEEAENRANAVYRTYGFDEAGTAGEQPFLDWFAAFEHKRSTAEQLRVLEERIDRYLDSQGVPEDLDLDELLRRAPAASKLDSLKKSLIICESNLLAMPSLPMPSDLENLTTDELAASKSKYEERALKLEDLRQRRSDLIAAIELAERDANLTQTERNYHLEYAALERSFAKFVASKAAEETGKRILEKIRQTSLPETLRAANKWLASFTSNRYQIDVGDSASLNTKFEDLVRVCDSERGWVQDFGDLSTATKVHMIIALQLARIEVSEEKSIFRFPLILDEAMAVSDPEASRAIAAALGRIAESRQVIVFTNQPQDVKLIRALVPDAVERTLTHARIRDVDAETFDEGDSPVYVPAFGPSKIDMSTPLRSHAPAALGIKSEEPTLSSYCRKSGDGTTSEFLDLAGPIFEAMRSEYPPLKESDLKRADGFTAAMEDRLLMHFHAHPKAQDFVRHLSAVSQIRATTIDKLTDWMEDNGFLWSPPMRQSIRERFSGAGSGKLLETLIDGIADALGCEA